MHTYIFIQHSISHKKKVMNTYKVQIDFNRILFCTELYVLVFFFQRKRIFRILFHENTHFLQIFFPYDLL